jgi:hypothetical protein
MMTQQVWIKARTAGLVFISKQGFLVVAGPFLGAIPIALNWCIFMLMPVF